MYIYFNKRKDKTAGLKKIIEINGALRQSLSFVCRGRSPAHFGALALHLSLHSAVNLSQDTSAVLFFSSFSGVGETGGLAGWSRPHHIFSKSVQALSCNCIVLPFVRKTELFSLKGHWNVYFTMCPI
jgi:hypothetical protein